MTQLFILKPARTGFFILMLLFVTLRPPSTSSAVSKPFALTLASAAPSYALGSDVRLNITMRNLSGKASTYLKGETEGFVLTVLDGQGRKVESNEQRPIIHRNAGLNPEYQYVTLAPGSSYTYALITLKSLGYSITQPGKYLLSVSRSEGGIISPDGQTLTILPSIVSNTIQVAIGT
jgi:hypothetical protein